MEAQGKQQRVMISIREIGLVVLFGLAHGDAKGLSDILSIRRPKVASRGMVPGVQASPELGDAAASRIGRRTPEHASWRLIPGRLQNTPCPGTRIFLTSSRIGFLRTL